MITIFLAGKKMFGDLTSDFERLRENSGFLFHYSERFESPDCGFNAETIQAIGSQKCKASALCSHLKEPLRPMVDKVHELLHKSDIIVIWMGNELGALQGDRTACLLEFNLSKTRASQPR